ncbi:MAG: hypothetical protein HOP11_04405 [Saprospiraceae bacterium]|nr:hypothetical protein [Saprospiraceae bacterium]
MYIGKKLEIQGLWFWAKKNIYITFALSSTVVILYEFFDFKFIGIPFLPVATIGTAVAFYVGFKNNQAYDRLWEARRLWGGFTNTSRTLAASFISLVKDENIQKEFLYRHIAYLNLVRIQLRKRIPWATGHEDYHQQVISNSEEVKEYNAAVREFFEKIGKMDIYEKTKDKGNIANIALKYQFAKVTELKRNKIIDEYEHSDLSRLLGELFNLQGGCERIKTTPLFRQFSMFSRLFVKLFIFILPFSLVVELSKIGEHGIWLVVPCTLLISWVFMSMEQVGESSENPFDNGVNDTPISSICRNIEIDILEMLGETKLPPRIEPYKDVLL